MTAPLTRAEGSSLPHPDVLHGILRAGISAPSAENKHYLRFAIAADDVTLISTDTDTWWAQAHRRMLDLMACGAVVENMSLQAASAGLTQSTMWLNDPARAARLAQCRWRPGPAQSDDLAKAIVDRHTNRRFYHGTVAAAVLDRIESAAAAIPGARLLWLVDRQRMTALHAIRIAETERFRRKALHRELFSAVRFEQGWHSSVDEGLPPGALAIEPAMRAPFAALRHWPLMRTLSAFGTHYLLGLRAAYLPCSLSPALGLILMSTQDSAMIAADAGRALERAWLATTREGLAFQPMAAATVLTRQQPGDGWVSPQVQQDIRHALDELTTGRADDAFMFFRIGMAPAPEVRAARPPLTGFM
jgi:hypothetical protein